MVFHESRLGYLERSEFVAERAYQMSKFAPPWSYQNRLFANRSYQHIIGRKYPYRDAWLNMTRS